MFYYYKGILEEKDLFYVGIVCEISNLRFRNGVKKVTA